MGKVRIHARRPDYRRCAYGNLGYDWYMKASQSTRPLYTAYLIGALVMFFVVYLWFSPAGGGEMEGTSGGQLAILPPKAVATAVPVRRSPQVHGRTRVGVVAGHWGSQNDPGAVCPDGLTEVSINLLIAELVVAQLEIEGTQTDLLEEFDQRQQGYLASALVSIHADSCEHFPFADPPATGFKVASLEGSENPRNQLLVDCLATSYANRTGLPFHSTSITYDMTQYHVFDAIDPRTPGAIIEVGFMYADREFLTGRPEVVAQGIVDGIHCFLDACQQPGD